ncbi:hypothetical protein DVH05_000366 [Phytophthora capsici]|nr:hypothetical protein DVH05_000366 [Phytophthora capsici]
MLQSLGSSSAASPGADTPSSSPKPPDLHTPVSPLSVQASPTSEFVVEPSQSPSQKKSSVKRRPKPRRGRNRPIHEITRLKQQIPVLEDQIRVLWARADKMQRCRLLARAENVQLKTKLQRSLDYAKLLESKLQVYFNQKQATESSMLPSMGAVGRNLPYEDERDCKILQMLSRSVDDNYSKVAQVYQAAELVKRDRDMEDTKVVETSDGSSVLQLRSISLQPFNQKTVLRAMWRALDDQTALRDHECLAIVREVKT